jgi:hypothetical protein
MKTQSIILAGLLVIFGAVAQAQEINEPAVKILSTAEEGVLKVIYAYKLGQPVRVQFYNEDVVLFTDKIKANAFTNGFSKKYDVHNIRTGTFFIEVSSETMSVIYKLTKSADGKNFIPVLENASYQYPAVASRN